MCDGEVDLAAVDVELRHRSGAATSRASSRELGRQPELAALRRATSTIRTTPIGKLLVRNVCMVFDRYHREPACPASALLVDDLRPT